MSRLLKFPRSLVPKISIIMVLQDRADLALSTVMSILEYADVPYEFIIVEDGASEEIRGMTSRLQNVLIHANDAPIGLLRSRNVGAQLSRGEWLLFMNAEMQMTPELLSNLLRTGESIQRCGAVGAKIIDPDGRLLEAGSVVWQDATCSGYGRGDDTYKPEYCYVREVDYCSAACLLVNRHFFKDAGMFDERYAPVYYEDTDLCLKLKEMGYRVILQPKAMAVHQDFEGAQNEDALEQQSRSRLIFLQKWQHLLTELYTPEPEHEVYAARRCSADQCRILLIDDRIPAPEIGSGFPRTFAILNRLAELEFQVTYFPMTISEPVQPCTEELQQKGVEVIHRYRGELDFRSFFEARAELYDAVWISRPHNMELAIEHILEIRPDQKIVYDAEGIFTMRDIRQLEVLGYSMIEEVKTELIREEIESLTAHSQIVTTVSEAERVIFEGHVQKPVIVVGHVVDIQATPNPFEDRSDILFVGGFHAPHSPNEDSMLYFVDHIFPNVFDRLGAKLWIVGTNHSERILRLASDNIVVTGRVDSLWDYYNRCRVFVAPTRYESGIPLKVLDCCARGLPSVVSPLIAELLGITDQVALIGHDPDDFADKIVQCYTDARVWSRLRTNAIKYVRKECNKDSCDESLRELKKHILGLEGREL